MEQSVPPKHELDFVRLKQYVQKKLFTALRDLRAIILTILRRNELYMRLFKKEMNQNQKTRFYSVFTWRFPQPTCFLVLADRSLRFLNLFLRRKSPDSLSVGSIFEFLLQGLPNTGPNTKYRTSRWCRPVYSSPLEFLFSQLIFTYSSVDLRAACCRSWQPGSEHWQLVANIGSLLRIVEASCIPWQHGATTGS